MRSSNLVSLFLLVPLIALVLVMGCESPPNPEDNPKALVEAAVAAVGGTDRFYALKDVEYTYTYHDLTQDTKDVSVERYIFDGELSWASYETRGKSVFPQIDGQVVQGYNGSEAWMTLDGRLSEEPQQLRMSDFLRKTNYYWFAMPFKLLDPGLTYEYKGKKSVEGREYDVVAIGFNAGIGDVQDSYWLYINPETKLVDQFLFTVLDFGRTDPLLMKVEYEEVDGVKLPAKRKYVPADWDGTPQNDEWMEEISTDIKFNNGFDRSMFDKPIT